MSGFLLDTNVLSEFNRRGEPDRLVKQWLEAADTDSLYASVLTLGEIRFGVELLPPSKRRTLLEQWLDQELPEWFEGRILPVDQVTTDRLKIDSRIVTEAGMRSAQHLERGPLKPDGLLTWASCAGTTSYTSTSGWKDSPKRTPMNQARFPSAPSMP